MAQYTFQYILKGSAPYNRVEAESDAEAYRKIAAFLATTPGAELVTGSIEYFHTVHRRLPDPPAERVHEGPPFSPETQTMADKYFAYKEAHKNEPLEPLTPLQKRMHSGGA